MVALCIRERTPTEKVDIASLLQSQDEEEEKKDINARQVITDPAVAQLRSQKNSRSPRAGIATEAEVTSLPDPQILSSTRPAKRLQPAPSFEIPAKKQSKWSAEEDALIIELRGNGLKWEDISKKLPGRSALSCRLHYQNYLERRSEWDEDRKNKLARLYERFKADMWSKIAAEMFVPWRAAEAMHWQLGEHEMARRAGVLPFLLTHPTTEPPPKVRRINTAASRPRRDSAIRGSGQQLPSVAELTAGVPAYASSQPRELYSKSKSPKSPSEHKVGHPGTRSGAGVRSKK
ncbi:MYB DNA-binding domain-containing protein [Histoplasma capsulatum var. duboisii H88]|uniref:MYB DNA-binding domain-containing protein n=2 Tax=Ajellomyces capsulatus TaxID=5037 RepID=F0UMK7_AJEC8|nr:MYB DNA-binding domain-containing protein [Histoplasma capsulatum H143]EGC48147.1 MYB DNA-binding domain-containing protein [Histoplasma capsulatum var. duboisii H88]QSS54297.1 MYB DNA-binding domain-containing protein [Histoplasma capsulatum var. duboisii H88]